MPEVKVRMGFTLNLGNMQFARADVELVGEGPVEVYDEVYEQVRDKVLVAIDDSLVQLVEKLEAEGWVPKV
jgi:hypothetical protein